MNEENAVIEEEIVNCDNCSSVINDSNESITIDNSNYCNNCTEECTDCNDRCIDTTTVYSSMGQYREVCSDCADNYPPCGDCGVLTNNNDCNNNGEYVCDSCASDYFECDGCGCTTHTDDYNNGYCHHCYEEEEEDYERSDLINSYDFKPRPVFYGKGPYYMGVELETESSRDSLEDNAQFVIDKLGDFAYLKEDGSLNNGFEIVTYPANLEEHKKHWPALLDNIPTTLKSYYRDTCGLHIHASRKHLSQLTIGKVLAFVNAQNNYDFIVRLAQRECPDYALLKNKKIKDVKYPCGKYEALNLSNSSTIEFRIFKGNLLKSKVFRALEFVDAIIKFCERANNSINDCVQHTKFIEYVLKRKKEYPELSNYCSSFMKEEDDEQGV